MCDSKLFLLYGLTVHKCIVGRREVLYNPLESLINIYPTARALIVKDMIEVEAKLSLDVTVNSDCPKECPVSVTFGTSSGNNCNIQQNATRQNISPGETSTFSVDADSVVLQPREYYCYRIRSPCGNFGE